MNRSRGAWTVWGLGVAAYAVAFAVQYLVWAVGVAVEMSTAGLRKPAGELYPSRALLEMLVDAGCPIALSSDAHVPDQLGYRYDDAVQALTDAGVRELCVFERRTRRLEPLG